MNELEKELNDLKFLIYFDGTFKKVGTKNSLIFEIRTKEKGHNEPHFHVKSNEFEASFSLNDFRKLAGVFPKNKEKEIIKWARKNINLLKDTWNEYHGSYMKVV